MSKRGDVVTGTAGLALAAAAVWFPWHVYLTPEDFGPPRMTFERIGPPVQETLDAHMAALDDMLRGVPVASLSRDATGPGGAGIDMTVTGSIGDKNSHRSLPVPEIVVAAPGRVLVRHNGRLDLWRVGSHAEDGRRVVSITAEQGLIVLRLDDGTELKAAPRKSR